MSVPQKGVFTTPLEYVFQTIEEASMPAAVGYLLTACIMDVEFEGTAV